MIRARIPWLVVGLAFVLLAGCARIATNGPVVSGAQAGPGLELHAIVPGPAKGASPRDIVSGYLQAALSAESDYAVARSYLTPQAADAWRPSQQTLIYDGSTSIAGTAVDNEPAPPTRPTASSAPEATVTVSVVAQIDAAGHLSQLASRQQQSIDLPLVQSGGQWRIGKAPNLTLVSSSDLDFVFSSYSLFFLDPTRSFLVPDPRWVPDDPSTPTRLAALLLAGPPDWLKPAVYTAFPRGTGLAQSSSVTVKAGVATVELSPEASKASPQTRGLMRDQMLNTLQPLVALDGVTLDVGGSPLDIPDVSVHAEPTLAPDPALLRGGTISKFSGARLEPEPGMPSLSSVQPTTLAMDYSGERFAILSGDDSQLRLLDSGKQGGDPALSDPVLSAPDLTPPSYDWHGWVWSTSAQCNGAISAVSPQGKVTSVAAPWLAGRTISVVRVARDGARAIIASTDGSGVPHLELASIARSDDGTPTAVRPADFTPVGVGIGAVRDATWVSGTELIVLGKPAGSQIQQVMQVEIGGPARPALPALPDARRVTGADGVGSVLVGTGSNELMTQAGARWTALSAASGTRWAAYSG